MTVNLAAVIEVTKQVRSGSFDLGRVTVKQDSPYYLFNYTAEAQYGGNMTEIEQVCRGLVIRDDGAIVALPMPKFFNLGEPQCPSLPTLPYQVWSKIDGSLCIFWHDGVTWRCNTRGSFENDYVAQGIEWFAQLEAWVIPESWTVMAEIVLEQDQTPRAVQHKPGLYLIAVRNRETGVDYPITLNNPRMQWLRENMRPVPLFENTVDELLARRDATEGTEGWVIRFDNGFRMKIKTAWYLRLFRAISSLTSKRIRELMLEERDWLGEFPDDLRPQATEIRDALRERQGEVVEQVREAYGELEHIENRKDFALAVLDKYRELSRWLFKMRDERFDEAEVLMSLDLKANGEANGA